MQGRNDWIWALGVIALGIAGCLAPGDIEADTDGATLVLSPQSEIRDWTRSHAERWSDATGLAVVVADGGLPVRLASIDDEPGLVGFGGRPLAAATVVDLDTGEPTRIVLNVAVLFDDPTKLHRLLSNEIAVALGALDGLPQTLGSGFASLDVDPAALSAVCEVQPCAR